MKRVRFHLGVEIEEGIVVKDNDNTYIVELLFPHTKGEAIPLENLRTGKVIKRHKIKHIIEEWEEGDKSGEWDK